MSKSCDMAIVTELREVADTIERELICCEAYDGTGIYAQGHDICYWAGAARQIVLDKIKEIDPKGLTAVT